MFLGDRFFPINPNCLSLPLMSILLPFTFQTIRTVSDRKFVTFMYVVIRHSTFCNPYFPYSEPFNTLFIPKIKNSRPEILKQSLKIDIKSVEAWRHPYEFSIDFCFASRSRRGANLMLMLNDAKMSHFFQYIDTHDF